MLREPTRLEVVGPAFWAFLLTVKRILGFLVNSETRHRGSEQPRIWGFLVNSETRHGIFGFTVHVHVHLPSRQDAQPPVPWRHIAEGADLNEGSPQASRPSGPTEHAASIYAHRAYYHIGRHTIIKGTGQSLTALVTSSSALRDPRVCALSCCCARVS